MERRPYRAKVKDGLLLESPGEAHGQDLKPDEEAQGRLLHEEVGSKPSAPTADDIVEVLPVPKQPPLKLKKKRSRVHVPRHLRYPPLNTEQILGWADAHFQRTEKWPTAASGLIVEASGDKWTNINAALIKGLRGLTGGSSLARLLAQHRGVRNHLALPPYTIEQILLWADAYFHETGQWPKQRGGAIAAAPGETWLAVEAALVNGGRGLPGGSSLAMLLAEHRGRRNYRALPRFTEAAILAWAEAYHQRTGKWPQIKSGAIEDAPGETWQAVDKALRRGLRGLLGGSSLAQLLAEERGIRNLRRLPRLTEEQIIAWAEAHQRHTGRWPTLDSGEIEGTGGETWRRMNNALTHGLRGLPGGSSLSRLLRERRGATHHLRARLSESQIVAWAESFRQRHGRWPQALSGAIAEAPEETWGNIHNALRVGYRGLPGGSSLKRLLESQQNT